MRTVMKSLKEEKLESGKALKRKSLKDEKLERGQ